MTAGGVTSVLRWVFIVIDHVIYWAIEKISEVFSILSRGTVFSQSDLDSVTNRVYMLVALIMLFRLAFAFINYIINPDQLTDSNKGGGKLIIKVVVSLVLLVATPMIFNEAYNLQALIIDEDIIGKLVTGSTLNTSESFSKNISYKTFRNFFTINSAVAMRYCAGSKNTADPACVAAIDKLEPAKKIGSTMAKADEQQQLELYVKTDFITDTTITDGISNGLGVQVTEYIIDYKFGISTIVGLVIAYLLICFCFDVAIRMIKLGFLQLIAPIPIVMSLAPGMKKDTLSSWGRECFSTYISLFLRLMIIYLAFFVIELMVGSASHGVIDVVTGTNTTGLQGAFVDLFAIIGALLFAKEAPKLIEQLFGLSNTGKITLNPLKALKGTPIVGGAVIGAGALAGGTAAAGLGLAAGAVGAGARGIVGGITGRNTNAGLHWQESRAMAGAQFYSGLASAATNATSGIPIVGQKVASALKGKSYDEQKKSINEIYKAKYDRAEGEGYYSQAEAYKSAGGSASQIFNSSDFARAFDQANAAKKAMNDAKSAYQKAYDAFNNSDKSGVPESIINDEIERIDQMRIDAGKAEGVYSKAKAELDYQIKANPKDAAIYKAYSAADDRHSVADTLSRSSGGSSTPPASPSSSSSSGLSSGTSGPRSLGDTH